MLMAPVRAESSALALPMPSEPTTAQVPVGLLAASVLDADALARLRELDPGDKAGLLTRVLNTYRLSLERFLGQLQAARGQGDVQAQRHVAHTLKSSSASVGALTLSSLCAEIELRLRDGPAEGLDPQLDALINEGQRVLAGLTPPAA
jgi:HPt (histidine-containing phosphotransfer) domain-containing protein